jgi:TRAP-type C4-dicarboxylate transport system permease small subunit
MEVIMKKLANCYNKFEEYALVLSLIITVIVIFIQVIARYVFNSSLSWSEEFSRYLFIWQTWLGSSVALRDKKHIRLEILDNKFGPKGFNMMMIMADVLWLAFDIFLITSGVELVSKQWMRGTRSSGIGIPLAFVYASLPFSSLVIAFRLVVEIIQSFRSLKTAGGEN